MVDVAEWPKWLNDVVTRLDDSSADEGPGATHGWARIAPTLRKELRDNCIELHHCHRDRKRLREQLEAAQARYVAIEREAREDKALINKLTDICPDCPADVATVGCETCDGAGVVAKARTRAD
jgi:hypothetical protein